MSEYSGSDVKNVSRTQSAEIIGEGDQAKQRVQSIAIKIAALIVFILVVTWAKSYHADHKAKAEAKEKADRQAAAMYAAAHPPTPVVAPEYPTAGQGHVTKEVGLKAYLDPRRTYLRPSRPVKYVFVEDPQVFFDDNTTDGLESNLTPHRQKWIKMPAGKYIVYAYNEDDKVFFRWSTVPLD